MSGGPGAIRTPDPQIRRLSQPIESKEVFGKPTLNQALSDQGLINRLQTAKPAKNENPGAEGIRKAAFQVAKASLLSEGRIRIVVSGPPSRLRRHLEVAS